MAIFQKIDYLSIKNVDAANGNANANAIAVANANAGIRKTVRMFPLTLSL
jgi:hypothetical protein